MAKQFAPGKVIISGEHSVVYGYPALTTSLAIGITVTVELHEDASQLSTQLASNQFFIRQDGKILPQNPVLTPALELFQKKMHKKVNRPLWCEVTSQLPTGSGLGSSSALASAFILALAEEFGVEMSADQLAKLVWEVEQAIYPQASPIDAHTVARGGVWRFTRSQGWLSEPLFGSATQLAQLIVIHSGTPVESTAEMVAQVGSFLAGNPQAKQTLAELGGLVEQYVSCLEQGLPLDQLIRQNHRLLAQLPVVGQQALGMIAAIEQIGGAAKITGAGGVKAGSGMILAYHQNREQLVQLCQQYNWQYLPVA